jgi:hypothetical protein
MSCASWLSGRLEASGTRELRLDAKLVEHLEEHHLARQAGRVERAGGKTRSAAVPGSSHMLGCGR